MGLPQRLVPIELKSSTGNFFSDTLALRMTSFLAPLERRAFCTTEIFSSMCNRVEIKVRPMPEIDPMSPFQVNGKANV